MKTTPRLETCFCMRVNKTVPTPMLALRQRQLIKTLQIKATTNLITRHLLLQSLSQCRRSQTMIRNLVSLRYQTATIKMVRTNQGNKPSHSSFLHMSKSLHIYPMINPINLLRLSNKLLRLSNKTHLLRSLNKNSKDLLILPSRSSLVMNKRTETAEAVVVRSPLPRGRVQILMNRNKK